MHKLIVATVTALSVAAAALAVAPRGTAAQQLQSAAPQSGSQAQKAEDALARKEYGSATR